METCEFCSKEVEDVQGTSVTGNYCIDCLRITISQCQNAIKDLKSRKSNRGKLGKSKAVTKKQYDNAFSDLIKGPQEEAES